MGAEGDNGFHLAKVNSQHIPQSFKYKYTLTCVHQYHKDVLSHTHVRTHTQPPTAMGLLLGFRHTIQCQLDRLKVQMVAFRKAKYKIIAWVTWI